MNAVGKRIRSAICGSTHRGVASIKFTDQPLVQRWIKALQLAPCLECGEPTPSSRVDCSRSGFPLTCSSECAYSALSSRRDVVDVFHTVREDILFTRSSDAATLLPKVSRRGQPPSPLNWQQFLRQKLSEEEDSMMIHDKRAQRLVSAAYTFVMTLVKFLPVLTNQMHGDVMLHIVGARAEVMMPQFIWDELGWQYPQCNFNIKLIGDQAPVMPKRKQQDCASVRLETWSALYHMLPLERLATLPSAFVLFNPGIGHPHLVNAWQPTLELMMKSGRPILITSFCERDQGRDLEALRHLQEKVDIQFLIEPQTNPFGSQTYQLDPECVFSPIQTNSCIMIVRGK